MSAPSTSASDKRGIWLRNLKFFNWLNPLLTSVIEQAQLAKNSLQSGLLFGVGFLMDWQTPVAVAIAALAAVYVLWRLARPFFRDQSHRDEPLQIDDSDD